MNKDIWDEVEPKDTLTSPPKRKFMLSSHYQGSARDNRDLSKDQENIVVRKSNRQLKKKLHFSQEKVKKPIKLKNITHSDVYGLALGNNPIETKFKLQSW